VAERLNTRLLPFNSSGSIWGWLSAHNGEVTGSKPVAGIIPFRSCFQNLAFSLQQLTLSLPVWRRGSAL